MSSHWDLRPKSVEAKNQRYLPPASQAGETESARPSVTCLGLAGFDVGDEDGVVEGLQMGCVGDPLRIGTPDRVHGAGGDHPGIVANGFGLAGGDVENPDFEVGIGVEKLLRIGRPGGGVVMGGVGQFEGARRRDAVLRFDYNLIFAGAVAEVREPFAVGRPGGIALGGAAGIASGCGCRLSRRGW